MEFKLKELIDIALFQDLQDKLNQIYAFPTAIIDRDGNVLTTTGSLDICTKFHRINPDTSVYCSRSDQLLSDHLHDKSPIGLYKCPLGLVDYTIPIIIEGDHLGVFCTGQCFLETPDMEFFGNQARKYGFDEQSYLEAVSKVPLLSQERLNQYISVAKSFTEILAGIGYRNLAEGKIVKTKRIYQVTSKINQAIVRLRERDKLLEEVCRIAIDIGMFQMAWIGFFEQELKIVKPHVFAGNESGYLTIVRQISLNDKEEGRGPTGRAIKAGRYSVCNDIENDPRMEFWREEALKRNYRSSIALPLKSFGQVVGAYSLYSSVPRFFDQQEIDLLNEVAENISYALEAIESENERKKAELALLAAKELAEESVRLKSAFLNNMSHEIRTPMNAIMGFSNLLMEAENEEKNQYAEIVQKSSRQLLRLIDDVMLLSRLQSEKLPLNITGFRPAELIADVHQLFNRPDLHKEIEFMLTVPKQHRELRMKSDLDKIKQALTIFTANALKYTHEGNVEIGFDLENENIRFYVKDTGLGIPEKEQKRIFDNFYRGEQVISSAIRGTGLGLTIARELVKMLGGKIGLISEPGRGSLFYLTIPAEQYDPGAVPLNLPQSGETDCKDFIILIAEDEPDNFHYLEILLKTKVKRIDHAYNGEEAIKLAKENKYNLILMDLKMPVMGGIEATRFLKQLNPAVPVIAQSAYSQREEKEAALAAGCDDYMVKPIRKSDLLEMLSRYGKRDEV